MFENLLYEKTDGIARVTVNRPAVRNALNSQTIRELKAAFAEAKGDDEVRVVILTGSGDKAFVAGADINELATQTPVAGKDYSLAGQAVFDAIENLGKPVIAAVNGYALGGGCELAMACTFRIASENAVFGQPEVKLGIIPGYGGSQRLPRLVGKGRAMQILLTGDMVPAPEAHRIGLVNQVVPQAELLSTAESAARKIMANGPVAVRLCMEAVHRGMEMTQAEGQFLEATLFALCCATDDMKEGTRAFLEKRPANFKGK
jgi:enoyl-CoA hydratase